MPGNVVLVSGVRTAVGKFGHGFNSWGQGVEKSPSERWGMNRTPCNCYYFHPAWVMYI